jgi:hypothetical protein
MSDSTSTTSSASVAQAKSVSVASGRIRGGRLKKSHRTRRCKRTATPATRPGTSDSGEAALDGTLLRHAREHPSIALSFPLIRIPHLIPKTK